VKIFGRKSLTAEIDGLHTRRDLLSKQLTVVEEKIAEATAARQVHLLEGNLDAPGEPVIIERLRDEKSAVIDALAAIDVKVVDAQRRLAEEQDSRRREVASRELTASADALAAVSADLAGVVARIPAALADVLSRLPAPHAVSPERIKTFADGLVEALQAEAGEARAYIVRLGSGDAPVISSRAEETKPPSPIVERREVFLLGPSRWTEPNGEVLTSGTHTTCSPPASIAACALEFGHALEPLSAHAIVLRQRIPPNYGPYAAEDCIDLAEPRPTKQVGTPTAALPPIHSEFVGRPRVGTARVVGRI
jgi:hypothetical protein